MVPTKEELDLYNKFQKSPIFFIEKMWGLTPQPVLPEYRKEVDQLIQQGRINEFRFEYFVRMNRVQLIAGKHFTWQQWQILLCIERGIKKLGKRRISVQSGHGTGKDACLSWLILWYLFCHLNAQIPCTAPTSEQMHDVLWKEVKIWMDRMPKPIADLFEWTTGYIRVKERSETWFARAKTARKEAPEALAGVHGDFVMFVIDEASGVDDAIYRVSEGSLTGQDVWVIMVSQHTRLVGYFHESHNKDRESWETLTLNSEESPVVEEDFINRIEGKYGKDSDEYRVQVRGIAPKEDAVDEKGFVPLLKESDIRTHSGATEFSEPKKMGLDPSGEGDDETVWGIRDAFRYMPVAVEKVSTPLSIAEKTQTLFSSYGISAEDTFVDNLGVGANVGMEIARSSKGDKIVQAVSFADSPSESRFLNKRAEMYWRVREWCILGGEVDEKTKQELLTIRYKVNLSGKIQVMSKEDMRKLYSFPSPNRADALALTFYDERISTSNEVEGDDDRGASRTRSIASHLEAIASMTGE